SRLHPAPQSHPPAVQRERLGPGGRLGRVAGRVARPRMPPHERSRAPLPLRRVHRDGPPLHAVARQLHPGRRGAERDRRLHLAPEGRRDRPAHDELRDGELPARDRGHPGGEPPLREGAQEGAGRGQGRVIRRLTLLGLGLLGGSVAKAARAEGLAREIVAVGRRRESLEPALRDGAVDRITTDVAEGVAGSDFCILATPVATLASLLEEVWRAAPDDAVLTDVGSTKSHIVSAAEALGRARPRAFIGGHPMAGSERSGYPVARADLFKGALVILTPTASSVRSALAPVGALGAFRCALDDLDRLVAAGDATAIERELERIKRARERLS